MPKPASSGARFDRCRVLVALSEGIFPKPDHHRIAAGIRALPLEPAQRCPAFRLADLQRFDEFGVVLLAPGKGIDGSVQRMGGSCRVG
jgi:hypothetical protein